MKQQLPLWLKKLLSPYCIHCNGNLDQRLYLCNGCYSELPWLQHACLSCGCELPQPQIACGYCIQHPQHYDCILTPLSYQNPINKFITQAKFFDKLFLCELLGQLLLTKLQSHYQENPLPNLIIPIPLHHKRLRKRGFNQALEIAKPLAKFFDLPIDYHSTSRCKATLPQTEIQGNMRATNVKNAFAITKEINAKHVAVLDDVITTGHTVNAFCKVLKEHGVKRIDVWCCAKTLSKV